MCRKEKTFPCCGVAPGRPPAGPHASASASKRPDGAGHRHADPGAQRSRAHDPWPGAVQPLLEEAASLEQKAEAAVPVRGGNETVLVAEDDASLRKLTRITLESFGYIVIAAEDGEDAIAKFMENRERIHLVMLDMIMPKKNGKEVSEAIHKVRPDVEVLFSSGYTADVLNRKGVLEEDRQFIAKPISSMDLLRRVREKLDKRKA